MLVQALYQNFNLSVEALNYNVYQGYYNNDIFWFNTATLLANGYTDNLASFDTASGNTFGMNANMSLKVNGFFRARKTGPYRFFTRSKDASHLEVDGITIVDNGNIHNVQNRFGIKSMIAGNYYPFSLFYGALIQYPPINLSSASNATTLSGQLYGNGFYGVSFSSENNQTSRAGRNLFNPTNGNIWRPNSVTGAWIQLELPNAIILGSYQVNTNLGGGAGVPSQFKLEGSNDNFVTSVLLNTTVWTATQGSKTIAIDPPVNQAFKYFRLTNLAGGISTGYLEFKYPLLFYEAPVLSAGFKEPLDDGSNPVSTDVNDYITNGSNLAVYYNNNPSSIGQSFGTQTYTYNNPSLYGRFKVSILSMYVNRPNFASYKNDLLYLYSPQLFNAFNGNTLIVIDEEPVDGQEDNSYFKSFCDGLEFECDLRVKIDLIPTRNSQGGVSSFQFHKILFILDVERIEQIDI